MHTPKPWTYERHTHADGEQWLTVLKGAWDISHNKAGKPGVIADADYSAMSDAENLANAKLIAAAPCLLEALQAMMEGSEEPPEGIDSGRAWAVVVMPSREALNKAAKSIRKATE